MHSELSDAARVSVHEKRWPTSYSWSVALNHSLRGYLTIRLWHNSELIRRWRIWAAYGKPHLEHEHVQQHCWLQHLPRHHIRKLRAAEVDELEHQLFGRKRSKRSNVLLRCHRRECGGCRKPVLKYGPSSHTVNIRLFRRKLCSAEKVPDPTWPPTRPSGEVPLFATSQDSSRLRYYSLNLV